jgi:hypothetical protein
MKKFLILFALLAFVVAGPMAIAAEKKVNCCVDGKLEKLTKAACKDAGGKVVKSAKQCKPKKK